jgi:hypothetical protein
MCDFAAHLVDVMPRVPIRQWVLSVPYELRFRMAFDPSTTSLVLRIFVGAISSWMRRRARVLGITGRLEIGSVTAIQRCGSALNLNVHFHTLTIDGVYRISSPDKHSFHSIPAPTGRDMAKIAAAVWRKVSRKLGRIDGKRGENGTGGIERDEPLLAELANASVAGLVATGHRRGARVLRVGRGPAGVDATLTGIRCATVEGFNVHAGVRIGAHDREGLERLARYLSRPPIANDRLEELPDGRLALRFKHAFRDGTEMVVYTPGELLEKLVLLVPRPRKHLTVFHGVLASASKLRSKIVPARAAAGPDSSSGKTGKAKAPRPGRHRWADLLRRVFAVDVLLCGRCGGRMRIIAALMDATSAARLLRHLGLPAEAPIAAPPRGPPAHAAPDESPRQRRLGRPARARRMASLKAA